MLVLRCEQMAPEGGIAAVASALHIAVGTTGCAV